MPGHDIVTIGASAGGLKALQSMFEHLPRKLRASVFITVHVYQDAPALLPAILDSAGKLHVVLAKDGMRIEHGVAYVAPPNLHLMLDRGGVRLSSGAKENRHRPAIDPLFRSAAVAYGPRVVGLVLSGMLDDGAAGMRAIKACGGTTLVQDPAEAMYASMPCAALAHAKIDYCAPIAKLADVLARLVEEDVGSVDYQVPESLKIETEFALIERSHADMKSLGSPSQYVCPSCHGSLTEMKDDMLRFRCHTGHAFSAQSLLSEQSVDVEKALFQALRAVEENAAFSGRMAQRYGDQHPQQKAEHENKERHLVKTASMLRRLIAKKRTSIEQESNGV